MAKKRPFRGIFSAAVRCGGIGSDQPTKAPIGPAKRPDFPGTGDLQKGSAEGGFPNLFRKQILVKWNKSEEIGANRNKSGCIPFPENKERKSEENGEIGRDRGDPLLVTPNQGLRFKDFCPIFSENLRRKPPFVSPH